MIEYQTNRWLWRIIFQRHGSVVPSAFLSALWPAIVSSALVHWSETSTEVREDLGFSDSLSSTVFWAAFTVPLFSILGYRTSQALSRFWEGTSLLHAMRGEWFDSASCLATFSTTMLKEKPEQVKVFRHTLMRLMSLCHGSALDEIQYNETESYEVLDHAGLDPKTLIILRDCKKHGFNRVEVILHMIQVLVINALKDKILDVPPPILSRVYQTLSRGFVHLLSAKKVRDTRFPFPYAQLIAVMLWGLVLITPVAMSALIPHEGWCALATFVPIFGTFALNAVAEELEMPYGEDANDLPLEHFQREMNSSLLMLSHDLSDHIASVGKNAHMGYLELSHSLRSVREGMFEKETKSEFGEANMEQERPMGAAASMKSSATKLKSTLRDKKSKNRRKSLYADFNEGSTLALQHAETFPDVGLQGDSLSAKVDIDTLAIEKEENGQGKAGNALSDSKAERQEDPGRNPFDSDMVGDPAGSAPIVANAVQSLVDQLASLAPTSARSGRPNSTSGRISNPASPRTGTFSDPGSADVHGADSPSPQVGTVNPTVAVRRSAWRQGSKSHDEATAGHPPEENSVRGAAATGSGRKEQNGVLNGGTHQI